MVASSETAFQVSTQSENTSISHKQKVKKKEKSDELLRGSGTSILQNLKVPKHLV